MAFADALALAQPCCEISACMQVAMDFSKSQQEDMLHLRRLFYGKLGQLSRARAAIMDQLPAEVQHVTDLPANETIAHDLADTTDWADQLCANGAEESRAHLFCAMALYGGVSCCLVTPALTLPQHWHSSSEKTGGHHACFVAC